MTTQPPLALIPLSLCLALPACVTPTGGGDPTAPPLLDPELTDLEACVSGDGAFAQTWSVANGHGDISAMALSSDGTVAVAGADGSIKLWELESGTNSWSADPEASVGAGYGSEFADGAIVTALTASDDGSALAAGDEAGVVRLWDSASGTTLAAAPAGEAPIVAVALTDDEERVVIADASYGGALRFWEPATAAVTSIATGLWGVTDVALVPGTSRALVVGDWYGVPTVELVDLDDPTAAPTELRHEGGSSFLTARVAPDGRQAVASLDDASVVLDLDRLDDPTAHLTVPTPDLVGARVAWLPSGAAFVAVGESGVARLIDGSGRSLSEFELAAPAAVDVDPNGQQLVIATVDGDIRLVGCEE